MASHNGSTMSSPLVDLAPAPARNGSSTSTPAPQYMPYTCQTCTRRKVKCDKVIPVCSTCRKAKLDCHYQAPPPRRKKRKLSDDVNVRLKQYEQILRTNGLLKDTDDASIEADSPAVSLRQPSVSIRVNEPETARVGKLFSRSGRSRYIDSNLWHTIGTDDMNQLSDEDDEPSSGPAANGQYMSDPLSGALTGSSATLLQYHPSYAIARHMWSLYVTNVDPICRVLHTPSVEPVFDQGARDPSKLSKTNECLLFAIYHFAVVSMSEAECLQTMQEPRPAVLARLRHATCQALVNAGFLRSSEMPILQAYLLYLLSVRDHYDPHTFWILSGVAWRIGQRMGLHRDGEILGLPPFEVQMRRRLFWQVLPMDGIAAQISGTGIAAAPGSWDVKQPWNVNEDQIWPGMSHQPQEQEGATDMIFCIARTEFGKFHNKTTIDMRSASDSGVADPAAEERQLEEKIVKMEDYLERKIVRYCDVVDPLHFLTISLCRGAMAVIRLRLKVSMSKHKPMNKENMLEVYRLAMKVVDYDISTYQNPGMLRYMWHFRALFLHSALACALTSLRTPEVLTPEEIRMAWQKIGQLMLNHTEIITQKRALHIALGRLIVKAWNASASTAGIVVEPDFIQQLREQRHHESKPKLPKSDDSALVSGSTITESTSPESFGPLTGLSMNDDFSTNSDDYSLGTMDWMYWDQLMQDFQGKPFG